MAQLCAAFLLDAERYYVDAAGKRSREVDNFRLALRALLTLHRDTATERFTINDLIAVRQALIDGDYGYQTGRSGRRAGVGGRKRSRTYINSTVRRIKQVFRWGTERRMVPGSVWHELSALRSLPIGRCAARETQPVEAVPWSMVKPVARRPCELAIHTIVDLTLLTQNLSRAVSNSLTRLRDLRSRAKAS